MIAAELSGTNLVAVRRCVNYRLTELLDLLARAERGRTVNRGEFEALRVNTIDDVRAEIRELHTLFNTVLT